MYKMIIADDEPCEILFIGQLLKKFPLFKVVQTVTNAGELLLSTIEYKPDLLLLDIHFGETNGFNLLEEIRSIHSQLQIIFITVDAQYAVDAFNHQACDYLLKPVSLSRLSKALRHFEEHYTIHNNPTDQPCLLRFNTLQGYILIQQDEVVCLEADQAYTYIRSVDNQVHHVSLNIGKIETMLQPKLFVRVSRSAIVNARYISEIFRKKRSCLLHWNGTSHEVKLSKSGIDKLESLYPKK